MNNAAAKTAKLIAVLASVLATTVALAFLAGLVLVSTSWGTQRVFEQLSARMGSDQLTLELTAPSGTLLSAVSIESMTLRLEQDTLTLRDVSVELRLRDLLDRRITLSSLRGVAELPLSKSTADLRFSLSAGAEIDALLDYLGGAESTGSTTSPAASAALELALDWQLDAAEDLSRALDSLPFTLLPEGQERPLRGQLLASGDYQSLALEHRLHAPLSVLSVGTVDVHEKRFQLVHEVAAFQVRRDGVLFDIEGIMLTTRGDASDFELSLAGPELALSARVSDERRRSEITLRADEPAKLLPELEPLGLRDLETSATVQWNEDASVGIEITQLSASVAEKPLAANASLVLANETITVNSLSLRTPRNSLALEGRSGATLALNFDAEINDWSEFLPEAQGMLRASGTLSGTPLQPMADLTLTSAGFSYQGNSLDTLSLALELTASRFAADFVAGALQIDGAPLGAINARGSAAGTPQQHRIDIAANTGEGSAEFSLVGGIPASNSANAAPAASLVDAAWIGELSGGNLLYTPSSIRFEQESPHRLSLSTSAVELAAGCWRLQETRLCGEANWSPTLIDGGVTLTRLSLDLLGSIVASPQLEALQRDFDLRGLINASGRFRAATPKELVATIEAELVDSSVAIAGIDAGDGSRYALSLARATAVSEAGEWRLGSQVSLVQQSSDLEREVATLDARVTVATDSSLEGRISSGAQDLRWIETLAPFALSIGGALEGDIAIAGSLSAPQFSGAAQLVGLSMTIPLLGITVENGSASLLSAADGSLTLSALADSGNGQLSATAYLPRLLVTGDASSGTESEPLSLTLRGDEFLLYDTEQTRLAISPNLSLTSADGSLRVGGSIDIPQLAVTLSELPESAIDVSSDTVVAGGPSPSEASLLRTLGFEGITGELGLTLGDDVKLQGFGLRTGLSGGLQLSRSSSGGNLAYGELTLEDGGYELYGQELEIREGRFLFFGALDNPGIDIRAVRQIDSQTVGVQMSGTLKSINSELFSSPNLSDTDIVSLLATGRTFADIGQRDQGAMLGTLASLGLERNQELTNQIRGSLGLDELSLDTSGSIDNSVLTVGKFITPRLFARYGVGLFDNRTNVSLDYTLSERLKLKAESGARQSVEFVYSVEK